MAEYTFADIIMDPNDPRLEGAIGKECYLSDFPKIVLDVARNNSTIDHLKRIAKEETCPFVNEEEESNWAVIIIKKEDPKPKYVPFETGIEFLAAYCKNETEKLYTIYRYLATNGIWLKQKETDIFSMVIEIWDDAVVLGGSQPEVTWDELLEHYTFIDGSPCGKLAEEGQ